MYAANLCRRLDLCDCLRFAEETCGAERCLSHGDFHVVTRMPLMISEASLSSVWWELVFKLVEWGRTHVASWTIEMVESRVLLYVCDEPVALVASSSNN